MQHGAGEWPLIGRMEALEMLRSRLASGERGVLVAGEAGVGKTRLCDELVREHVARGGSAIRLAATASARTVPLGPLLAVISSTGAVGMAGPAEAALSALLSRANGSAGRFIIFLDDLHHADEMTIAVLEQAVVANDSVFLLATHRTHADREVLPPWSIRAIDRFDLDRLADSQVGELLTCILGPELDATSRAKITSWASGRPLYLQELVGGLRASGRLARQGGRWVMDPSGALPNRVADLVEARLGHLAPGELEAMVAVCLAEPVPVEVLLRVVSRADVERLEGRHLLRVDEAAGGALIRPAHPLYSEVIRQRPASVMLRHRLAGELAAAYGNPADDVNSITQVQLLDIAGVSAGHELLASAARIAYRRGDNSLASALGLRAARLRPSLDVALLIAEASSALADHQQSDTWYRSAVELAVTDEQWAAVALSRARTRLFAGRGGEALEIIAEARRRVIDRWVERSLREGEAEILGYIGQWDVAHDRCLPTITAEDAPGEARYAALCLAGFASTFTGPHRRAVTYVREAKALGPAVPIPTPHHAAWLVQSEAYLQEFGGAPDRAIAEIAERASRALAQGQLDWGGHWTMASALFAVLHGSVTATTIKHADDAVLLLEQRDPNDMLSFAVSTAALAHSMADLPTAAGYLRRYDEELRPLEQKTTVIADRASLWLAARGSERERAALSAHAACQGILGSCPLLALPLLHDLARLGFAALVLDDLRQTADRVGSLLGDLMVQDAAARAKGDPVELLAVARRLEENNYRQLAADAYMGVDQLTGADNHRTLIERLTVQEVVVLPRPQSTLRSVRRGRNVLTARELQVALLAVERLTNREIGEKVGISKRTVDRHISNILRRLGIGRRTEIEAALEAEISGE